MRVIRVIDGDTFVIKTGDRVRLVGLDAPETGKCGAEEAKEQLTKLLSDEVIKIEEEKRDVWGRRLGIVNIGNLNVNLEMVKSGWARYDSFSDIKNGEMKLAGEQAENNKLGIYGISCADEEKCVILGNIDESTGRKYYHLPECPSYSRVIISPERGEQIFCSESEALKAGFVPSPDCVM